MINGQRMTTLQAYMSSLWNMFKVLRDDKRNLGLNDRGATELVELLLDTENRFQEIIEKHSGQGEKDE